MNIRGGVKFDENWYQANFGVVKYYDPLEFPLRAIKQARKISADRQRKLRQRFPDFPIFFVGSSDPKSDRCYIGMSLIRSTNILWYDPRRVFCVIYGAPRPRWDHTCGIWWHNREKVAWDWVRTLKDIESIKIPRWEDEPEVKAIFKQREIWRHTFPGRKIYINKPWHFEELAINLINYPSFIEVAPMLLGNIRFFKTLIYEPKLAHALLEKFFEICTSYIDFLIRIDEVIPDEIDGLILGGDYYSTLSPKLIAEYSRNTWDKMVIDHFKEISGHEDPLCTVHSCGASVHLYEEFSKIPNVVHVSTRYVRNGVEKLRKALPHAHLQIDLVPPQVNFENVTPEEVTKIMWEAAEGAGFRDISFRAHCPAGTPDDRVKLFYRTLQEINDSA